MHYKALILKLKAEKAELPKLYMACGTEDFLLEKNRDYHKFLLEQGIGVTYEEGPGGHEWDFWDRYIHRVLEWLPLEAETDSVHSGSVE
jgi:S-formylglutathione hydrolase FrmB